MTDGNSPDISHPPQKQRMYSGLLYNRGFQIFATALALSLSLASCGSPEQAQLRDPIAVVEPQQHTQTLQLIEKGKNMTTPEDREMLDTTIAGIDLTYFNNQTVNEIRSISDPRTKVLSAIGFLDVEHSQRYNGDAYACNTYALDLLRLVLGNNVIGSRFNTVTGEPTVAGLTDIDWTNPDTVNLMNSANPFLHSNNLDWWMQKYGTTQYGWIAVSPEQLDQFMKTGKYIGLAVNRDDFLRARNEPYGHSAVIVPNAQGTYGISQATRNIEYRPRLPEDPILDKPEEYDLFLHEVPHGDN